MEKKIKAGLVQQSNVSAVEDNIKNIAKNIENCARQGARLVVLQELHNSLYFCQTEDVTMFNLAEAIPGPSTDFYSDLAVTHHIVLVTSLFEKR
ncbi:Formamidase, partial [termite gut metagenome]